MAANQRRAIRLRQLRTAEWVTTESAEWLDEEDAYGFGFFFGVCNLFPAAAERCLGLSPEDADPAEEADAELLVVGAWSAFAEEVGFVGVSVPEVELEGDSGDADFLSASAERLYDSDR